MYTRRIDDRELTFRFHPDLFQRNLLIEDLETGSVWSQLGRNAVEGPLTGKRLGLVPMRQTTWGDRRSRYLDTLVIRPVWGLYPSYRYIAPRGRETRGLSRFSLVLGLEINGARRAYPFPDLARASHVVEDQLGGSAIRVLYEPSAPTAHAEDESGNTLPSLTLYWGAWLDFYPDTGLWIDG